MNSISLPDPVAVRSLYRALLRHVAVFPSIKRQALAADVRAEFREKATILNRATPGDAAAIVAAVEVGLRGLATMRKYTSLDARSASWKVDLEQDPLGEGAYQQKRAEGLAAAAAAAKLSSRNSTGMPMAPTALR